jgi:TRAP-type mannitol/chloroaromatic compound transport system permease small subunit
MTSTTRAWARGGTVLAATVLLIAGIFELFQGIAAIIRNNFYVVGANYLYNVNVRTWGWIHLGIGIVAILAGLGLFTGALWARIAGVTIAALSAIANFFWLPYYPFWALLIIAFDIFAIWAISRAGREVMAGGGAGTATGYSGEMMQGEERWPSTNPAAATGRHYATGPRPSASRPRRWPRAAVASSPAWAASPARGSPRRVASRVSPVSQACRATRTTRPK